MRPKGLRNIRTIQGMARRSRSGGREQTVAELARLEHEKARLLREVDVWQQNMRRTNEQLQRVEARLATLHARLEVDRPDAERAAAPPAGGQDWEMLSLEY